MLERFIHSETMASTPKEADVAFTHGLVVRELRRWHRFTLPIRHFAEWHR